jgi:hypothetical protein
MGFTKGITCIVMQRVHSAQRDSRDAFNYFVEETRMLHAAKMFGPFQSKAAAYRWISKNARPDGRRYGHRFDVYELREVKDGDIIVR